MLFSFCLIFFANFSLALLTKVLLIKKRVSYQPNLFYWYNVAMQIITKDINLLAITWGWFAIIFFIFIKDLLKSQRLHLLYQLFLLYLTLNYSYDSIKIISIKKISICACHFEKSWYHVTRATPEIQGQFRNSTFFHTIFPLHEITQWYRKNFNW